MTRILILLASFVLANSAHAEIWLCGTSSLHSSTFGTAAYLALSAFFFAFLWVQVRYWRNRRSLL